jgi:thiamine kinase-like enzyme
LAQQMTTAADRVRRLALWTAPVDPIQLQGGLSNQSFLVTDGGRRFVVRLGEDLPQHHVSRARELQASRAAAALGLSPEVVYAESGVIIFAYIAGCTLTAADVRNNIGRITRLVRRYHVEMPQRMRGTATQFCVFRIVREYAATLTEGGSRLAIELPRYLALSSKFEQAQVPLPTVFSHNDLLPANFIEEEQRIWLIDHEYAAFSTSMFDLAGLSSNAHFSPIEDRELLACYYESIPSEEIVRSYAAMKCASLLREAMWGMVSQLIPGTINVDYAAYAKDNLERFEAALESYQLRYGRIA